MKSSFFGTELQSPFIIGSGPLSYGAEGILRLNEAGAGAVVTKTITLHAAENPYPHMITYGKGGTLLNCEKWSDYPMERWLEKEIPASVNGGARVIASVGHTWDDASACVERLEDEGVLAIELVSYREETVLPMLRETRKRVKLPIIIKISPNISDLPEFVRHCTEEGADAFTACDSIGPAMRIDIETGKPALGGAGGTGWVTGESIHPFIVEKIAETRRATHLPVIGLGGIMSWQDAVESLMAGADWPGVCTALILKGPEYLRKLIQGVDDFLDAHGYGSIREISGIALGALPRADIRRPLFYDEVEKCTSCRRCVRLCPYEARSLDTGTMAVDEERCRHCGLCASLCPRIHPRTA